MIIVKTRRDTAANWTAANPVLPDGQLGYDKTNGELRMGDGVTPWNALPVVVGSDGPQGPQGIQGPPGADGTGGGPSMVPVSVFNGGSPEIVFDNTGEVVYAA